MKTLILGSGSPRRKELLAEFGFKFSVITTDVEESTDDSLGLEGLAIHNAELKAQAVFNHVNDPEAIVIGSDTVVWLDDTSYGKPKSTNDSERMLSNLSGKTHQVGTGVSLVTKDGTTSFCEIADVTFKELSQEDILSYIRDIPVSDKAGSYAIQDGGDRIIERFTGEFECIMGLPKKRLIDTLEKLQ